MVKYLINSGQDKHISNKTATYIVYLKKLRKIE